MLFACKLEKFNKKKIKKQVNFPLKSALSNLQEKCQLNVICLRANLRKKKEEKI